MKKSRLLGAVCASLLTIVTAPAQAAGVSGQGTWETTLLPRSLDGDNTTAEAYYDTVLGITWLGDANYAGTTMNWATANSWAAGLDLDGTPGPDGWRLPDTNPVDGTTADDHLYSHIGNEDQGYNVSAPGTLYVGSTASKMAHMFHNTLGNLGECDPALSTTSTCSPQSGYGLSNPGPFSNVQSDFYWSSTVYAPFTGDAWAFNFLRGSQDGPAKSDGSIYAWAIHDGDFGEAVVPIPPSLWLFGSGLLGLVGMARRKP